MIEFVELFVVGIGVGAFGALVGIGGGMIMVPLFMLTMMAPNGSTFENVQQVIGTSLFGVLLNALSGTWAYIRQHKVMFRAAVPFALATVPGAHQATQSNVPSGRSVCFSNCSGRLYGKLHYRLLHWQQFLTYFRFRAVHFSYSHVQQIQIKESQCFFC